MVATDRQADGGVFRILPPGKNGGLFCRENPGIIKYPSAGMLTSRRQPPPICRQFPVRLPTTLAPSPGTLDHLSQLLVGAPGTLARPPTTPAGPVASSGEATDNSHSPTDNSCRSVCSSRLCCILILGSRDLGQVSALTAFFGRMPMDERRALTQDPGPCQSRRSTPRNPANPIKTGDQRADFSFQRDCASLDRPSIAMQSGL